MSVITMQEVLLCIVLHWKPYKSVWDNYMSVVLSFTLLVTLVSGVCLRLFDLTEGDADEYQKQAFGIMLMISILICLVLSVLAIVLSTECLRDRAFKNCSPSIKPKPSDHVATSKNKVVPLSSSTAPVAAPFMEAGRQMTRKRTHSMKESVSREIEL